MEQPRARAEGTQGLLGVLTQAREDEGVLFWYLEGL
jgi:hypothetical protein